MAHQETLWGLKFTPKKGSPWFSWMDFHSYRRGAAAALRESPFASIGKVVKVIVREVPPKRRARRK